MDWHLYDRDIHHERVNPEKNMISFTPAKFNYLAKLNLIKHLNFGLLL